MQSGTETNAETGPRGAAEDRPGEQQPEPAAAPATADAEALAADAEAPARDTAAPAEVRPESARP
ncbi:apolipoprotein N-acyltransferase, partial [Streptomyces sp. MCAF7]